MTKVNVKIEVSYELVPFSELKYGDWFLSSYSKFIYIKTELDCFRQSSVLFGRLLDNGDIDYEVKPTCTWWENKMVYPIKYVGNN